MRENNNSSSNYIESLKMLLMTNDGIIDKAIASLGKGFDMSSDFRLKYCKGNKRLVLINEEQKKQLFVPGFGNLKEPVSVDIKCDKGDHTRHQSDFLEFNQMSEFFNRLSAVSGKIPSGLFNALFKFEGGSWAKDAANIKLLGLDGFSIVLFNMHIERYPLILSHEVRKDVPSNWDPSAIARFIEKYGTHIIVGISIGGQDMVLVKQEKSSKLDALELKKHLYDLGDQLFTGTCQITPKHRKSKEHKKVPSAFNIFQQETILSDSLCTITSKDGITVICAKRGGDPSFSNHPEWLPTVSMMPDAINFSFIPITSLLKDVPGKGFLSHAINLYLRYKPPIADLQYFLDFQSARIWAPLHSDLPLAPTTNISLPSSALHFNIIGPKLHVNTTRVNVENKPVTGMRLYLEGMKCNRLAIHVQHLANAPLMLENKFDINTLLWRGSDEIADDRFSEPVQKKYSHICTAPVKYDPSWTYEQEKAVYIVTGAQLYTKKQGSKQVLHLRLLFSKVLQFQIVQSEWCQGSSESSSQKLSRYSPSSSGSLETENEQMVVVDSSLYPTGPPVPVQNQKFLRFVNTNETSRGPQDNPGYWIVTGARLNLVKSKICLQVKFSLINMCP